MIAIIAAMDVEVNAFKILMTNIKEDDNHFFLGELSGVDVVLAKSGVGKVGASIITTSLINHYDIDLVINIGSAGGLKKGIQIGDIIIASDVAHHDIDIPGWPKGFNQYKTCFHANEALLKLVQNVKTDLKCHFGPMVSGDSFICKASQTTKIITEFPEALCVEMEASSVAQCANYFNVPFLILRSISDITIEDGNEVDFEKFVHTAAKNSADFCAKVIKEIKI